jgi:hypothetical protein
MFGETIADIALRLEPVISPLATIEPVILWLPLNELEPVIA